MKWPITKHIKNCLCPNCITCGHSWTVTCSYCGINEQDNETGDYSMPFRTKTTIIATLTAFLALYIGLEAGYRIGYQSAVKSQARAIQEAIRHQERTMPRYGGLGNGY